MIKKLIKYGGLSSLIIFLVYLSVRLINSDCSYEED